MSMTMRESAANKQGWCDPVGGGRGGGGGGLVVLLSNKVRA